VTENSTPEDSLHVQDVSPARLHGEACIDCGTADQPLFRAGRLTLPGVGDIVHDYDTVACAAHRRAEQ